MIMLALLGMSLLGAQEYEYVPFVREGVKWVYYYENPFGRDVLGMAEGIQFYSFGMMDDVVIGGKNYKPVVLTHYLDDNTKEVEDFIPVYLREEGKVVYAIHPDGVMHAECPVGIGTCIDASFNDRRNCTSEEYVLYDFNDPIEIYDSIFEEQNRILAEIDQGKYISYTGTDTIMVGDKPSKRHNYQGIFDHIDSYLEGSKSKIIEGIGYDGNAGMPLLYFQNFITGFQVDYHLSHVIENDQIIYKGAYYKPDISLGINEVVADQPERMTDGNYYNLMGQSVGKDVPTVPGIYIHQGKKILVR